ncbi:arabinogalactan peptide 16-like [Dorcoceras hygrometricum]|uniref:Arabinogalactan peptide 16-like n=1 Tax=Dorcoceras hygrometricum TaxID=472368 RepID=A0A2Z7CFY2_9LAMI|nr:arabinogalactan peptide 16-like [Dorcoceras hygrometricum]
MEILRLYSVMAIFALFLAFIAPAINAQFPQPAPAPAPNSNDGVTIDQGVAYVLMLVALAITYMIH